MAVLRAELSISVEPFALHATANWIGVEFMIIFKGILFLLLCVYVCVCVCLCLCGLRGGHKRALGFLKLDHHRRVWAT